MPGPKLRGNLPSQLLSYVLGSSSNLEASIKRAGRFVEALPGAWIQGGPPQALKTLAEQLKKLTKNLEAKRRDGLPGLVPLARILQQTLDKMGEKEQSQKLSASFKL